MNKILEILEEHYPDAKPALRFTTPFELLIATMLSAQTTDKQVNKITEKLFKKYNTPEEFADMEQQELEQHIKGCGLYKNKSKNIINASKMIISQFDGKVPETREELMRLPGVGRKTANVVISNAFGKDAIAVDTHVFRVSNRLGLADSKNVGQTEKQLMENIPKSKWSKAHHWLIYHGRQICTARNPKCDKCPLSQYCRYYLDNHSKYL